MVTNQYIPFVIVTIPILYSVMTYQKVLKRVTRRVPLVQQELLTLTERLRSSPPLSVF